LKDPETLDPDWARYPNTVLRLAGDVMVDLRRPVGEDTVRLLSALGLSGPFAVITAHDPRGEDLSPAENAERGVRFEEELRSSGVQFVHVDACSPDGEHCEASLAAKVSYDSARQLALDHRQVAFFWFDGERFWIAGGLLETDPVALPRTP
jgi:hypothetical protein